MKIEDKLIEFKNKIAEDELKEDTKDKYIKNVIACFKFCKVENIEEISKEKLITYKEHLKTKYQITTVNNKIIMINKFLKFAKLESYCLELIKIQKRTNRKNVLTTNDYERLKRYALKKNKYKFFLIMKTIAETGIRIEELKYITVETCKRGYTELENKNKIRTIVLNKALCKELLKYCKEIGIKTGIIFHGRNKNQALSKSYIWKQLQYLAGQARVKKVLAHAHSFRGLFAKVFMDKNDNLFLLADLLGHSSLETTRLYVQLDVKQQRQATANLYK